MKKYIQNLKLKIIKNLRKHSIPEIKREYTPPSKTYKKAVCITGFGYSGSGALIDLLSEYDNVTSISYTDKESGKTSFGQEVDFFRDLGSPLILEKLFDCYDPWICNTFYLNLFITGVEYYYKQGGIYNDEYYRLSMEFLNKLIAYEYSINKSYGGVVSDLLKHSFKDKIYRNLKAPFVYVEDMQNTIYFRKNIGLKEYRTLAKEYITAFLNTIESNEFLILDQFLSCGIADINLFKQYLDNFKWIAVYRDPRDRFAALKRNPKMKENPQMFIDWYKQSVEPYTKINDHDFKLLRFEDLILNYKKTVSDVEKFIGLRSEQHNRKLEFLNPDISIKNVGLYKKNKNQKAIQLIEKELGKYCYFET